MLELRNPLPHTVRDTGKIDKFFKRYGPTGENRWVIPYYGNSESTSHSFLALLNHLTAKSPSYKSAETGIVRYAFGGFEDNTIFDNLRDTGITKSKLLKALSCSFRHSMQSGNGWLRVEVTIIDAEIRVRFKNEHYCYVAYLDAKPGQVRDALVVAEWDYELWGRDLSQPEILPVSTIGEPFNWRQKPGNTNVFQTLVHFRNEGNDESDWYGRPDILAVLEWMYSETAVADHSCKVNSTDLVTKLLLFFEQEEGSQAVGDDDDEEDSFTSTIKVLRSIVTNEHKAKPTASGLAAVEYGNGTKPPTPVKLDINRDTNWFKSSLDEGRAMIYSVMGWFRELTGMSQSKTGIGSNVVTDLFLVANAGTIEPIQEEWEENVNFLIDEIGALIGRDLYSDLRLRNKIDTLVSAIAKSRSKTPVGDEGTTEE